MISYYRITINQTVIDITPPRMLKKIIAKEIIVLKPFSITEWGQFLQEKLKIPVKEADAAMQNWALAQSDSFSEKDWQNIQFRKLKRILCHAQKNILYWKILFKRIGFFPKEMKTIDDIRKIPVITRSELKKISIEDLLARNISKTRFVSATTSGSTGEPFQLYLDKRDLFRRCINTTQEFRYVGAGNNNVIFRIGLKKHKDLDDLGPYIDPRDIEDEQKRHESIYPLIRSLCPRLLVSTPSYLERFLFFCEKDEFRPKIEHICYMGEQLNPEIKAKLENFFMAIVYTTYGTRECSLIGIQCENQSLHLAPWMNFVEIVDGQIVVTTFENEVMPFIRYAIGDGGKVFEGDCGCERKSKTIEFNGRATFGTVEFTDGSAYQMSYISQYLADKYSGRIKKFQFEQVSFQKLSLRYVPILLEEGERIEEDLKMYFRSIFHDTLEVVFQRVESILPNEFGKTPLFIKKITE